MSLISRVWQIHRMIQASSTGRAQKAHRQQTTTPFFRESAEIQHRRSPEQSCQGYKAAWLYLLQRQKEKVPFSGSLMLFERQHRCFRECCFFHYSLRIPVTQRLEQDGQQVRIGAGAFLTRVLSTVQTNFKKEPHLVLRAP